MRLSKVKLHDSDHKADYKECPIHKQVEWCVCCFEKCPVCYRDEEKGKPDGRHE